MTAPPPDRLIELLAINRVIAAASDYTALLRLVVERTAAFLDAEIAVLLLADETGQARIAASVGMAQEHIDAFESPLDESIGSKICGLIACDPDRFLAAPVIQQGTTRGLIAVYRHTNVCSESEAAMLSALADQAAIALAHITQVQQLQDALAELREADRRKDGFLGMLSHELRNPLAPIRTAIYLLGRTDASSDAAAHARLVIQRQTEHLTRLIDDLLDVTRIARGKITLHRELVNLNDIVRRAAEDHRSLLAEQGLKFRLVVPPQDSWVLGDATRLVQLIGNLLQNAAKFTPTGGEVTLAVQAVGSNVEIRVRDTGKGVEAPLRDRIFEPFVQAEQPIARTHGGLGLGLALVKGVAQLHGGMVRVESAGLGAGAEFIVTMPLAMEPQRENTPVETVGERARAKRVLVVDDNRDAAESLADLIAFKGHTADVVFDGVSAVEQVQRDRPDVVLCDVGLPGMSGYEVAKQIRAKFAHEIRLIAVSGYAQPDDVRRAMEAGFDAHVAKPPDPADIDRFLT